MADLNIIHQNIGKLLKGVETLEEDIAELKDDFKAERLRTSRRIGSLESSRTRLKAYVAGAAAVAGTVGGTIVKLFHVT
ncbi:MAG: hypothetical protein GY906_23245 [bacterium]|nr:hypothetical protein [bacterium]